MSPEHYRRNSYRYPGYDYSQPGGVFITIRAHNNQQLFGNVIEGQVSLSEPGQVVDRTWSMLSERFPAVIVDAFIVMPDHLHGILFLGTDPSLEPSSPTVGIVVNSFKNAVSSAWRVGVQQNGWPRYAEKLWQRDYYDRIIRNDIELEAIREYIKANPARWSEKRGT